MATFGWSVGDLVRAIDMIMTITGALRESGGASDAFQESVHFLCGLELTLQNLRVIISTLRPARQRSTDTDHCAFVDIELEHCLGNYAS